MNTMARFPKALLIVAFVTNAANKLLHLGGAQAEVVALSGLQPAALRAALVMATQLGGSLLLVAVRGRCALLGALLLAGFGAVATLQRDIWWTNEGLDRFRDLNPFWEQLALLGGLLLAGCVMSRSNESGS